MLKDIFSFRVSKKRTATGIIQSLKEKKSERVLSRHAKGWQIRSFILVKKIGGFKKVLFLQHTP